MQLVPGDDQVHAARPGHRPSGPPYLHLVYTSTQVRVYWLSYWFCLIGETWEQVINPWCNAIKKYFVHHLRLSHVIALVMDIRAFLSSKAAEPPEQGSNKTTKTPTLKRGSGDSGSSTFQSSSKRKLVRTWLNKPSMAHVQLWSKCYLQPDVTDSEEVLYSWSLFCWVQWNNELYFTHDYYISSCLNCLLNKNNCFVLYTCLD